MTHLQTKAYETDLYQLSEESLWNNAAKSFVLGLLEGWHEQACTMDCRMNVFDTSQLDMLWQPHTEQ